MKYSILVCAFLGTLLTVSCRDYQGKEAWDYVTVRKDAHMFWWMYYADVPNQDYLKYPLVIWLQGGPGASSTGYGNFMEVGPLDVNLKNRNTTWAQKANLLFIDNPVGSGYSYVTNKTALATNNTQIADDLVFLIKVFLNKIPEFQTVPIYIFCESYGGKMTAGFAAALYQAIKGGKITANFKGIALGDSWISPLDSVATWGPYLYATSLIDSEGLASLSDMSNKIRDALMKGQFANATTLWSATEDLVEQLTNGVNFYNILTASEEDLSKKFNKRLISNSLTWKSYLRHVGKFQADPLDTLMNGPIKDKLQVIPKNVTWGGQSQDVFSALQVDFMKPVTKVVDTLLNSTDIKVVVYSGQLDLIVDTVGTLKWVQGLKWPGIKGFIKAPRTPIVLDKNLTAGFFKTFKNFSFFWILRAGHMVPADSAQAALQMMSMITEIK